jgi:hypothetical protein
LATVGDDSLQNDWDTLPVGAGELLALLKYNPKHLEKHPEADPLVEAGDRIKIHRSIL